jgi:prolyl-tRNA editing enzyme YbaK/EbsC (Cys-tRNA(Pro) deacylase)
MIFLFVRNFNKIIMNNILEKKTVKKVEFFLKKFNYNIKLIVLDQTARTAFDAAKSLNTEVGSIVKSLLFKDSENNFHLCLVSGDKFVSLKKISNIYNSQTTKASADECKKFTGFSIGGVSPVAHANSPKSILIDTNLSNYEKIFAAAGHPHVIFEISFIALCDITRGTQHDITD